jgi:hypothetical protein
MHDNNIMLWVCLGILILLLWINREGFSTKKRIGDILPGEAERISIIEDITSHKKYFPPIKNDFYGNFLKAQKKFKWLNEMRLYYALCELINTNTPTMNSDLRETLFVVYGDNWTEFVD